MSIAGPLHTDPAAFSYESKSSQDQFLGGDLARRAAFGRSQPLAAAVGHPARRSESSPLVSLGTEENALFFLSLKSGDAGSPVEIAAALATRVRRDQTSG